MSPTFTPDDVGKNVESADGERLGVVAAVDRTTAYVEPDPGVADSIKAVLDWQGGSEPAVPLADDAVREITDDSIRLEAEFPEESITTAETDEDGGAADGAGKSGREEPEIGSARGEPVADTVIETETDVTGRDTGAGTGDLDESEPAVDDEFYDAPEGGARVDPDDEMDGLELEGEERANETTSDESEATDTTDVAEELESVEAEASRELEVDPTELTDGEPEAEIDSEDNVGRRTDVGTGSDDVDSASGGPTTEDARTGETEGASETDCRPEIDDVEADADADDEADGDTRDEDSAVDGERDGEPNR